MPEGLGAAWAVRLAGHPSERGLDQALIMMAVPAGLIIGALVVGRLLNPARRRQLIRPFAILVPVALTLALLDPDVAGVAVIGFVIGFAVSGVYLPTNGLYAQALPTEFRARAFGVFQFGAQLVQALGLIVTGVLSDHFPLHIVVGAWGAMGIVLIIGAVTTWPTNAQINAALDSSRAVQSGTPTAATTADDHEKTGALHTDESSPSGSEPTDHRLIRSHRRGVGLSAQPSQRRESRRPQPDGIDEPARMNTSFQSGRTTETP